MIIKLGRNLSQLFLYKINGSTDGRWWILRYGLYYSASRTPRGKPGISEPKYPMSQAALLWWLSIVGFTRPQIIEDGLIIIFETRKGNIGIQNMCLKQRDVFLLGLDKHHDPNWIDYFQLNGGNGQPHFYDDMEFNWMSSLQFSYRINFLNNIDFWFSLKKILKNSADTLRWILLTSTRKA